MYWQDDHRLRSRAFNLAEVELQETRKVYGVEEKA